MISEKKLFYPGQIYPRQQIVSHKEKHYLVVSSNIWFDYKRGRVLLPHELGKVRTDIVEPISDEGLIPDVEDKGMPKVNGEWLLYGECYPKTGSDKGVDLVSVEIAGQKKELAVFGEREWIDGIDFSASISEPEPFDVMPISPARAYGGEGDKANPHGIGVNKKQLPHVEYLNKLIVDKNDAPQPAFFCALDNTSPERIKYIGTYDEQWAKTKRPAHPDDMDWRMFHTAPVDQRIDGFFTGDESFVLKRLHPEEEEVQGKLPGFVTRMFYTHKGSEQLQEMDVRLDTLTFFSSLSIVTMTWRAVLEIEDDEASMLDYAVMAYENGMDARRPVSYYQQDFAWRKKEVKDEPLYISLITGPLLPDGEKSYQRILHEEAFRDMDMNSPLLQSVMRDQEDLYQDFADLKSVKKGMDAMRQKTQDRADTTYMEGHDVGGFALANTMDQRLRQVEEKANEATRPVREQLYALQAAKANEDGEEMAEAMRDLEIPVPPEMQDMVDEVEAIIPNYMTMPLRVNADYLVKKNIDATTAIQEKYRKRTILMSMNLQIDTMEKQIEELRATLKITEHEKLVVEYNQMIVKLEHELVALQERRAAFLEDREPKEVFPRADMAVEKLDGMEEHVAKLQDMVDKIDDKEMELWSPSQKEKMAQVKQGMAMGILSQDKLQEQFTTADADFKSGYRASAHAMPEGLPPIDPLVSKEQFLERWGKNKKNVAGGDYACVDFSGMNLSGTNFSDCYLEQTNFNNCNLQNCNFSNAIMPRALLHNADLAYSNLEGANIGHCDAHKANFVGVALNNQSCWSGGVFDECNLSGLKFTDMSFDATSFRGSTLSSVIFDKCFFYRASFKDADVTHSRFTMSSAASVRLVGADFSDSVFYRSSFVYALMQGTRFERAKFDKVTFTVFPNADDDDIALIGDASDGDTNEQSVAQEYAANAGRSVVGERAAFDYAVLDRCCMQGIDLSHSTFRHTFFEDCTFSEVVLRHCDFSHATFVAMDLSKMDLEFSSFESAQIMGIMFLKSNLRSVNFRKANMYSADLIGSKVGRADFSDANLNLTIMENWRPNK